jgi:hypothetical protein
VRTVQVPGPTSVVDIDDDGTIVGMGPGPEPTTQRSYRWRPAAVAQAVRAPSGATDVGVVSIHNGWIAGYENTFPAKAFAVRRAEFNQIDGMGTPYSGNGRGDLGLASAIVHRDGRVVPLPGLGSAVAQAPRTLSDRGRAAGFANDGAQVHAVRWHDC